MQRVSARVRMTTVTMPPRTWEQAREQPGAKLKKLPANVNDRSVELNSEPEPPSEPKSADTHVNGCGCGDPQYHLMRERKRQTQVLLERLRAHFKKMPGVELYSVEAGKLLGCRHSHATSLLRRLEYAGFLASRHEATSHSGHGRRYYKLREGQR